MDAPAGLPPERHRQIRTTRLRARRLTTSSLLERQLPLGRMKIGARDVFGRRRNGETHLQQRNDGP
ncbi:MAG TPA: hypothetical protein VFK43_12540, partial [Acidimicrobiales bacterium]|nr:hypothetical protein [Acidimicrobiales bacterium]